MTKQLLLASDFDQTLSFNDSGVVLSELIGFHGFDDKVKGLSEMNLVQQGAELSYLILHDPDFRKVRREHLVETGKRIRLKHDVALFARALDNLAEGYKFHFNVISAAPQEIIQSALEGIVPPDHIFGTRFRYNRSEEHTSELQSRFDLVCRLLLEKKKKKNIYHSISSKYNFHISLYYITYLLQFIYSTSTVLVDLSLHLLVSLVHSQYSS